MTVIVAVSDGTRVCMACDSQASNNGAKATLAESKIYQAFGVLFAADGSMAVGEFFRRHFTFGPVDGLTTLDRIAADFAISLRCYLREHGLMRKINDSDELPCQILVAYRSRFVLVDAGGSVVLLDSPWWAIGSGAAEARGAMWEAQERQECESGKIFDAGLIANSGVSAAIALDDGCGHPVRIAWTNPKGSS